MTELHKIAFDYRNAVLPDDAHETWTELEQYVTETIASAVAKEREACVALCFQMWDKWIGSEDQSEFTRPDAEDCAAAIRARGQV